MLALPMDSVLPSERWIEGMLKVSFGDRIPVSVVFQEPGRWSQQG